MFLIWPTSIDDSFSQAYGIYFKNLFICFDEFILQVPDNLKS